MRYFCSTDKCSDLGSGYCALIVSWVFFYFYTVTVRKEGFRGRKIWDYRLRGRSNGEENCERGRRWRRRRRRSCGRQMLVFCRLVDNRFLHFCFSSLFEIPGIESGRLARSILDTPVRISFGPRDTARFMPDCPLFVTKSFERPLESAVCDTPGRAIGPGIGRKRL